MSLTRFYQNIPLDLFATVEERRYLRVAALCSRPRTRGVSRTYAKLCRSALLSASPCLPRRQEKNKNGENGSESLSCGRLSPNTCKALPTSHPCQPSVSEKQSAQAHKEKEADSTTHTCVLGPSQRRTACCGKHARCMRCRSSPLPKGVPRPWKNAFCLKNFQCDTSRRRTTQDPYLKKKRKKKSLS